MSKIVILEQNTKQKIIFYLFNSAIVLSLLAIIYLHFCMQFRYENLQENIASSKNQIAEYEDQLRLLEVEWVYLTRPERLRQLTEKFLKNNRYMLASQVQEDFEDPPIVNASLVQEQNRDISSQNL
jgi:hypothetical protein